MYSYREELVRDEGCETNESLAKKRHVKPGAIRTWVSRQRVKNELFTVKLGSQVVIPSVQLDDEGNLDGAVTPMVKVLREAGMDHWALWSWLCFPTGLLSDEVPAVVAHENPERALTAANRMAAELGLHRPDVA